MATIFCGWASPLRSQENPSAAPSATPSDKAARTDADYQPGPDSKRQPDVPRGKIFQFPFSDSKVFPGTTRTISVYVPAQYTGNQPACVYVALDGLGFDAPIVFDNLIHKREMPVVIAIGVSPGQVPSAQAPTDPRFNRSFEFDGLNDALARLVLDEVLPEVEKHKTPDGLPIVLSHEGNDRCTGGGSTGGIAAFTLAWERPDAFRRVFTAIGTFVGMRGGDRYPVLIRKTEPKPLRVFMQDGENDQWGGGPEVGDWWNGNQGVERALRFSGYQVEHAWGVGGHSGRHATQIFPDAMRWLWKDWPAPVTMGETQNTFSKSIVTPCERWQELLPRDDAKSPLVQVAPNALAADSEGAIYFRGQADHKTYKFVDDETTEPPKPKLVPTIAPGEGPLAIGADGRIYAADRAAGKITAYDSSGAAQTVAEGVAAADFIVLHDGSIYIVGSEPGAAASDGNSRTRPSGKAWLVSAKGEKSILAEELKNPAGVALSPDGLWLAVAEHDSHWGYSYRVAADGKLDVGQQFYWFHVPDWADESGAGAWRMDRDGRLYSATQMGVQVFDRNGRSRLIMPLPAGKAEALCFGGPNFDTLFVISSGRLYKRKLKAAGSPVWAPPTKLPGWGAG